MAYVDHPSNKNSRSLFLNTCAASIAEDEQNGTAILSARTVNLVVKLNEEFHTKLKQADQSATARAHEVAEKSSAMNKADLCLHHFWIAAKNKALREEYPAAYLTHFGLPLSGILPKTNPSPSIFPLIETVLQGESDAVAAGYAPMSNPSAEELAAVKAAAEKEASDVSVADKELDRLTAEMAEIRDNVDKLARDIILEFRFLLRDEDEPSQRRIMRKYGIVFKAETEEVIAE